MARKRRQLSADEKALWSTVAATVDPLAKPVKAAPKLPPKTPTKPAPSFKSDHAAETPPPPLSPFKVGQSLGTSQRASVDFAPDVSSRVAGRGVTMDPKTFRKLSRGRLRPEGRIDLHGMTLDQAHPALTGFIMSSFSAGKRLVLVITGKGSTGRDSGGPIPERRGVLRDQVPRWLSNGPCKSVVMQVAQAHASHGGGGAYYVYLRRSRK